MTTEIPPERVPPIAKEVASTRKTWAALWWLLAGFFVIASFSAPQHDKHHASLAARIIAHLIMVGIPFWLGLRQFQFARCAQHAIRHATEGTMSFVLSGRELLAYNSGGVPQPDMSMKISRRHTTMLTAPITALPKAELPRAELRS